MKNVHSYGRFATIMLILILLLILGLMLNLNIGSVKISAGEILRMLLQGDDSSMESRIIWSIRIPRMLLAATLGGALSVSGFLLQTFFRNPIAGPFVLGISSGAKLVVGVTMIFFARYLAGAGSVVLILAAFLGSIGRKMEKSIMVNTPYLRRFIKSNTAACLTHHCMESTV